MTDQEPTLTYDPELDPGYFIQVSSQFVRHPEISIETKMLYMVLLAYVVERATKFPEQRVLCVQMGVSEKTLRVAARALVALKLLTVRRPGQGKSLVYHVHKLDLRPGSSASVPPPAQIQNGKNDRSRTVKTTVLEESKFPSLNGKNDRSLLRDTEKITEKKQGEEGAGCAPPAPGEKPSQKSASSSASEMAYSEAAPRTTKSSRRLAPAVHVAYDPPDQAQIEEWLVSHNHDCCYAAPFLAHYGANGWMQNGNKPVFSWPHALVGWIERQPNFSDKYKAGRVATPGNGPLSQPPLDSKTEARRTGLNAVWVTLTEEQRTEIDALRDEWAKHDAIIGRLAGLGNGAGVTGRRLTLRAKALVQQHRDLFDPAFLNEYFPSGSE